MKRALLVFLTLLVTIILLHDSAAIAQDFIIEDGDDYYSFEASESRFGFPTPRIDMIGGHVGDEENPDSGMFTYDFSILNVYDGTIDYLHAYNSSTVNILGGLVSHYECWATQTITANDSSTVNVHDGALLYGGSFHTFDLYDSGTLNVYGGDVALLVLAHNSSIVNIYDGRFDWGIIHYDYSKVNVYGGHIDFYTDGDVPETATVNIYGYDFNYDPNAEWRGDPCDGFWIGKLTGYGADGTRITYWGLPDPATHSNINLIPDFVMDRGVNLADFAVLASAWRTSPGDDNWNPICDISDPNDGVIDWRDLAVLTKHWLAGTE